MDVSQSIQALADTLRNSNLSAKAMLDGSISDLKNSLASTSSTFGPKNLAANAVLGGVRSEVATAKKLATDNLNKVVFGLTGTNKAQAIQNSVAFVTGTTDQLLKDPTLLAISDSLDISKFSNIELQKIKDFTGISNLSPETITNGLTDRLSQLQITSASISSNLIKSMQLVDSGLLGGVSSFKSTLVGAIPDSFSNISSYLPINLRNAVGSITNMTAAQLTGKFNTINSKISSILSLGSNAADILKLGGNYSEVTNMSGMPINGLSNRNVDYNTVNSLYRDARNVCDNVNLLDLLEFGNIKDVFDILVNSALNNGMSQLLRQLMNCGVFADKRTGYIMQQNSYTAAYNGDIYTLNAIQDYVGPSGISTPKQIATVVAANMEYDDNSSVEFDTFLNSHNLTKMDLVSDETAPEGTLSSQMIGFLGSKSSKFVNSFIDKDTQNTAVSFLHAFH